MENRAEINKILFLIKYDYRWFYYFNEQMNSFKSQYIHKYNNKNKYKVYLVTREKYNKRLQKKKYFENLYLKNKFLYYTIFLAKLFSKYIRKQLYNDIIYLCKSGIITFTIEYFGFKNKLKHFLPSLI